MALATFSKSRAVHAAVVVSLAFSSTYASAATLRGGGEMKPLAAGNTPVRSCTDAVALDYDVAFDHALPGYRISAVKADGLHGCAGSKLRIDLTGRGGASLGTLVHLIDRSEARAGYARLAFGGHVAAGAVQGAGVVVSN